MRLTVFTDYTLRTLIYLAVRPDRLTIIGDIAAAYDISANHLMKVVHQLSISGDIATQRGHNGGMRLARAPDDINIGAVVRRTEPDMGIVPCFGTDTTCALQPDCMLASALEEALAAFMAVLDRYTLADIVKPRSALASLLGIVPADG